MKKTVLFIYGIGILFLLYSAVTDIQVKDYWALTMDLEFIGFAIYMIFGYPKRKLKLNQDLMTFLMIHFSIYALMSIMAQNWLMTISSAGISIGLLGYRLYRRKHKYNLYLK
jgi:hypothetical protein